MRVDTGPPAHAHPPRDLPPRTGCGRCLPARPSTPTSSPRPDVPMSDPPEYAIDRITRDAGKAIFERTGIGDRTCGRAVPRVSRPVRRGARAVRQDMNGARRQVRVRWTCRGPQERGCGRASGLARGDAPDDGSIDRRADGRDELRALSCREAAVAWWEALVYGLGNKRVRIHAYDRAFRGRDVGSSVHDAEALAARGAGRDDETSSCGPRRIEMRSSARPWRTCKSARRRATNCTRARSRIRPAAWR